MGSPVSSSKFRKRRALGVEERVGDRALEIGHVLREELQVLLAEASGREAVGGDLVVDGERAGHAPFAAQRRGDQRADGRGPLAQRRVLGHVAHQQRRAPLDGVDRGALVEPEELLLETAVGGPEVGADHEAPALLVLEPQDRVIGLEHHRGRRGAEAQHLGRIGGGDHAQARLVDRADLGGARGDARLALRGGDLLGGGGGDLEQRLLDGAPARRVRPRRSGPRARPPACRPRPAAAPRRRGSRPGRAGRLGCRRTATSPSTPWPSGTRYSPPSPPPSSELAASLRSPSLGVVQVGVHDAASGAQRDERAELVQPLGQRRLGRRAGRAPRAPRRSARPGCAAPRAPARAR